MSGSPVASTSRAQTRRRRRRSPTPPRNTKKRTLPPRKAANLKRRAPSPEPSKGSGSDDRYEYISIAESEDSASDLELLDTPPRKPPAQQTRAAPDDGITPRRQAKHRHYRKYEIFYLRVVFPCSQTSHRNQVKLREESRLRMQALRAKRRNQLPDGAKKKQAAPRRSGLANRNLCRNHQLPMLAAHPTRR